MNNAIRSIEIPNVFKKCPVVLSQTTPDSDPDAVILSGLSSKLFTFKPENEKPSLISLLEKELATGYFCAIAQSPEQMPTFLKIYVIREKEN